MKKLSDILQVIKEITEKATAYGFTNTIKVYKNYQKGSLCLFVERNKDSADKKTEYVPAATNMQALTYELATFLNCQVVVEMLSSFSEEDQYDMILKSAELSDKTKLTQIFGNLNEVLFKEINTEESDDEYNDDLHVAAIIRQKILSDRKTPKEPDLRTSTVTASCSL